MGPHTSLWAHKWFLSVGDTFDDILNRATVIEHVTSDPYGPKATDLRFEDSMPPLASLKKLTVPATKE